MTFRIDGGTTTLPGAADADVVRRAAAGDEAAWQELVCRYGGRLRAIGLALRLAPGDVEDAVQMTWLGLFRNLDALQSPDKVGGWLCTTMRRNSVRLLRTRGRELPTDDLTTVAAHESPGVDDAMLRAERAETLWRAVERLPDGQARLVRALFGPEQRRYRQIASDLSIPVGTIGPVRQRALRRLAELLAEAGVRRDHLDLSA